MDYLVRCTTFRSRDSPAHWRNFWATNSGPLSDRMCSGIPRHSITSDNVSITSRLPHPSLHSDRQAFPPILVQQRQQPQRPSIVRSGANKVIAPYVVAPLRPQSYTGTVVQPQSSSRPVFLRHFQPVAGELLITPSKRAFWRNGSASLIRRIAAIHSDRDARWRPGRPSLPLHRSCRGDREPFGGNRACSWNRTEVRNRRFPSCSAVGRGSIGR